MKDETVFDVIIAGCGPVGAIAAHVFAARGMSVLVVERDLEPYTLPRAIHIDHEIMRILQSAGLAERMLPHLSVPAGSMHFGADLDVIRQFHKIVETPRLGWASDYFFYQPDFEAELRAALADRANVDARFGVELSYVAQDETSVTVRLSGSDGVEVAKGRYLLACDGARSQIRKDMDVELSGLDFDEPWIVVDANVDGRITFPPFRNVPEGVDLQDVMVMVGDPSRPKSIIPGFGRHRRWEFMMLPHEKPEDYSDIESVNDLIAPWAVNANVEVIRAAVYRFHALLADTWRLDRVFLAGDAAHLTPPFYGQGLCHGVRDISNLAWKLDLVLHGKADAGLLDTYQPERQPQVKSVIESAIKTGKYICTLDPEMARQRDEKMRSVALSTPPLYFDVIPPLTAGILDLRNESVPPVGSRFIQPPLRDAAGRTQLMDEYVGSGFTLILRADATLPATAVEALEKRGVRIDTIRFAPGDTDPAEGVLLDESGELGQWFDEYNCVAALIRPDFYVFGTAGDESEIDALTGELHRVIFG